MGVFSCHNKTNPSILASSNQAPSKEKILLVEPTLSSCTTCVECTDDVIRFLHKSFSMDIYDSSVFDDSLKNYNVLVLLNSDASVFTEVFKDEIEQYVQAGGNLFVVHAGDQDQKEWPELQELIGAKVERSVDDQTMALVHNRKRWHPTTSHLPQNWRLNDHWMRVTELSNELRVLLILKNQQDKTAYHPISWFHPYGKGQAMVTLLGHTESTLNDPLFQEHLKKSIQFLFH